MTPHVPPAPAPPARDRLRPFRRVNLPTLHTPPADMPGTTSTPIDGRGYRCGCRAATDYDGKIGEDIGNEIAEFFKVITGLKAIDTAKDALSTLLGKIPVVGPAIRKAIQKFFDDIDPLKNLFKRLGKALDALLADSIIRGVPLWVPVFRGRDDEEKLLEQEMEGRLVRSFQRYDSVPFTQWHGWYDWCFRVAALPGDRVFERMIGAGNIGRDRNDDSLEEEGLGGITRYDRDTAVATGADINRTIDCDWDLGALGEPPGPMLTDVADTLPRDWMWPMTGSHFWATGRSVFDCGHATSDEKSGKDGKEPGLHLNKLVPCKAIATARLEGVKFAENPLAVPAVQFMFYASRTQARGHQKDDTSVEFRFNTAGDFRFPSLADADYEFVVDLPEPPERDGPFAIGATPATLLNTIVPGAVLLHRFDVAGFLTSFDFASNGGVDPEIEPIRRDDGGPPTQVRLRFPLTKVTAPRDGVDGLNTYGVIVSLGWFDPGGVLASTVHKVTVILDRIRLTDVHESATEPELFINLAVNGRWFQFAPAGKTVDRTHVIELNGRTIDLFLDEEDAVAVSAHGMEADGLHDLMKLAPDRRHKPVPQEAVSAALKVLEENFLDDRMLHGPATIKVSQPGSGEPAREIQVPFVGRVVEWARDVDQKLLPKPGKPVDPEAEKKADAHASIVTRAMFLRLATVAFDANDVLGMIDPNVRDPEQQFGRSNDALDAPNPFKVANIIKEVGFGRFRSCRLTAYKSTVVGRTANLAYARTDRLTDKDVDYTLEYRVRVDRQ